MKQKNPLVSVVMPVYNAGDFLVDAIESILNQTYKNIEFIIVDDASTDTSWNILQRYAKKYPKKIKLLRNHTNMHQAVTVSRAIAEAKGTYIARMDADDISFPQRLEKQIAYLEKHNKTVAVGSQCLLINKKGQIIGEKKFPTTFEDVYRYIFQFCPIQQPTVMIAAKRLPKNFQYYAYDLSPVEDVEFIFKLFQYGRVENMPEYLHMYRIHGNNSSLKNFKKSFLLTLISRIRGVLYHGYIPTVSGILVTLMQIFAVFLLPQSVTLSLYTFMKKIMTSSMMPIFSKKTLAFQISKAL